MTMAFDNAFEHAMLFEGGFVNDPKDPGGETYRGIARKRHPNWKGWATLDMLRDKRSNATLSLMEPDVKDFYLENFWKPIHGDFLPQDVAIEMFDTAVNQGVGQAARYLQEALNLLNRNATEDLVVDGQIGNKTLSAVRALAVKDHEYLRKYLNVLQGARYIEILRRNPKMKRFARGWLNRVVV